MNTPAALDPDAPIVCAGAGGPVPVPVYDELHRLTVIPPATPAAAMGRITPHGCTERAATMIDRAERAASPAERDTFLACALAWRELAVAMCQQIGMIPPRSDDDARR